MKPWISESIFPLSHWSSHFRFRIKKLGSFSLFSSSSLGKLSPSFNWFLHPLESSIGWATGRMIASLFEVPFDISLSSGIGKSSIDSRLQKLRRKGFNFVGKNNWWFLEEVLQWFLRDYIHKMFSGFSTLMFIFILIFTLRLSDAGFK